MSHRQHASASSPAHPIVRRHGDLLVPVYEADPDGRPVVHHRVVDTIGRMLRNGSISREMHDAARDFAATFTIAQFDTITCMSLDRVSGSRNAADPTDVQLDARRRVAGAIDALGGFGSPAGGCVWHVVGLQCSIREWAMRQGWGGKPIGEKQAHGILVAALGVLVHHYGYGAMNLVCPRSRSWE
ncbi:MAG: hypothetical protein IPK66_15340 [Rhodospirillales bacterium]|nr:hypothetical protein [Rhodospirillales bacterium]